MCSYDQPSVSTTKARRDFEREALVRAMIEQSGRFSEALRIAVNEDGASHKLQTLLGIMQEEHLRLVGLCSECHADHVANAGKPIVPNTRP